MKKYVVAFILFVSTVSLWSQVVVSESSTGDDFPIIGKSCASIFVSPNDCITVGKVAQLLADDIARVTGTTPQVQTSDSPREKNIIVVGTIEGNPMIARLINEGKLDVSAISGGWEQYVIKVIDKPSKGVGKALVIAGTDRRGAAYGAFELSEAIGVSPWYWWADVPVTKHQQLYVKADVTSKRPSVKYRGIFLNDEDWGLKPWASENFEKELGDIGPKTYSKICELILRLKGNMLAPAMHSCTGAFYSHKESKLVADTFGIIITTSHCEPLLLNNAAKSEWDQKRDGDWNYKTNAATIRQKWENRLTEASQYENIYTMAMRGLHDAGLRGNLPMEERVPLIEQVIKDQRSMLCRYKQQAAEQIPQIFVPYKETMDIYEAGLRVPDDITLVWVDDNYGYMKRVSNPEEQQRSGGAGVYYHLSYLGAPHDYLWLNTMPPVLMYEELKKAYDAGADRYWLLNVGDIKPMELGLQTFFDLAWNLDDFDFNNVNSHQTRFLTKIFGQELVERFQIMLDEYYRLAWSRKPEFMGWEREWDTPEYTVLKDTEFSFSNYNEAQHRLYNYQQLSDEAHSILYKLSPDFREAFFEMLAYPVMASCQMNRKFLMAQLNHELQKAGKLAEANWAAIQTNKAHDSIQVLNSKYNNMLGGKWKGMMSLAPGMCALYQNKPEVIYEEEKGEIPVNLQPQYEQEMQEGCYVVDLFSYSNKVELNEHKIELIQGLGYDWEVIRIGQPFENVEDAYNVNGTRIEYTFPEVHSDSVYVYLYTLPFFPIFKGRSTAIGLSVDGENPYVYENKFKEYSLEWKNQVLQNGDLAIVRFAVDKNKPSHVLSIICGDPGMMVQKIIIDWGGLKKSYVGPSPKRSRIYKN